MVRQSQILYTPAVRKLDEADPLNLKGFGGVRRFTLRDARQTCNGRNTPRQNHSCCWA